MTLLVNRGTPTFLATKNMALVLNSWSNTAVTLRIRGLTEHNILDYNQTTNSDRSKQTSTFQLPEFPLGFTIFSETSGLERGECYIQIDLIADGTKIQTLCQGYVSDIFSPSMGYLEDSLNGSGKSYVYTGTDPGANTEISITVPTNTVWEISNVAVLLTQSGAGSTTREVNWKINDADGNNIYQSSAGTGSSSASGDAPHLFSGYGTRGIVSQSSYSSPMPNLFRLTGGMTITTSTANLQSGDNYKPPNVLIKNEWIKE
jgi:hypothetical protein